MESNSAPMSADRADNLKSLRDFGLFLAAAVLAAALAWLTNYGVAHPDVYWVPFAVSVLGGAASWFNRFMRDSRKDVLPTSEPAPPSDWKMS